MAKEREFHFTDEDFWKISKMVGDRVGIVLKEHKKDMVYSRIARRLRVLGLGSFKDYLAYLQGSNGEKEITGFINAVTTNLTKFFREDHHFDHLSEILKSEYMSPNIGKKYRIWSAGCSSGMEAYSIAMTARKQMPNLDSWDFKILATDIDTNMLERGSSGVYREADLVEIPQEYRKKYITRLKIDDQYNHKLSDDLRNMVRFKPLNLLEEWPMRGLFDIVFCRNVVIYFDKPTQQKLFDRMADQMADNGWLYIGHSENLSSVTDRFELIGRTIYRKVR